MTDHPMQPSPEQVGEWLADACRLHPSGRPGDIAGHVAQLAYAAGADAELEACCEWLEKGPYGFSITASASDLFSSLRAARRPKPPSLKQQGRNALALIMSQQVGPFDGKAFDVLCLAIEALPDDPA